VPSVIAATRHTAALATATQLITVFVNFVFMVGISFYLTFVVMAFVDLLIIELSFPAVHWSTWQDSMIRYAKKQKLSEPRIVRICRIREGPGQQKKQK
jgi:hypothetical protein